MAVWKAERNYAGKTPQEIYTATKAAIESIAGKYGLKHESQDAKLAGTIKRTGVDGNYQAAGDKLTLTLDFGFLVPGAIREKAQNEITKQLDKLFG